MQRTKPLSLFTAKHKEVNPSTPRPKGLGFAQPACRQAGAGRGRQGMEIADCGECSKLEAQKKTGH